MSSDIQDMVRVVRDFVRNSRPGSPRPYSADPLKAWPLPEISPGDLLSFIILLWEESKDTFFRHHAWLSKVLDADVEAKSKMPAEVHGTLSAVLEIYEGEIQDMFAATGMELSPTIAAKLEQAHMEIAERHPRMVVLNIEEETMKNYERDVGMLNGEMLDIMENTAPGSRTEQALSRKAGRSVGQRSRDLSEREEAEKKLKEETASERDEAVAEATAKGDERLGTYVRKTMEQREPQQSEPAPLSEATVASTPVQDDEKITPRQEEILYLLRPKTRVGYIVSAKSIMDRFSIAESTLYKDLKVLRDAGHAIGHQKGTGYYLEDDPPELPLE